ncbi:YxlC family protein [Cytobacillus massiliigabonensis]|uniref:YxlC family protein n=1 Tax=Cytobacillus massiliigabonensis TaxID=1871011 RepID=UPI000C81AFF4|nr:YxlC family protein [Cytobacillus massiliigabonensis]
MDEQKERMENEYIDESFLTIIKEIEDGLESVEQHIPVYSPNLDWFENMVTEKKKQLRKKLIFDVSIFSIVALLVLSAVLFTLYNIPAVFFAVQGLVAIFIIGYISLRLIKQVKET